MFLNAIVMGELRAAFAAGNRRESNEKELREFLGSARVEVLPLDGETSHFYAAIRHSLRVAGTPIPANDVWIASSAMQHGLRIVTTDRHFRLVSHVLVEWFP